MEKQKNRKKLILKTIFTRQINENRKKKKANYDVGANCFTDKRIFELFYRYSNYSINSNRATVKTTKNTASSGFRIELI